MNKTQNQAKFRSHHRRCSIKKGVLKNLAKLTREHLCQSLFFNKVADLRTATLFKKSPDTAVFLWILRNFQEHIFYRTPLAGCFSKFAKYHYKKLKELLNESKRKSFNEENIFSALIDKDKNIKQYLESVYPGTAVNSLHSAIINYVNIKSATNRYFPYYSNYKYVVIVLTLNVPIRDKVKKLS